MLPPKLKEVLQYYERQVSLAEDRIRMFESGEMSSGDAFPPFRDTTAESIQIERSLIANFQGGIEILRKLESESR